MRLVLSLLALAPAPALALPWAVPDASTQVELSTALDAVWQGHDLEVTTELPTPEVDHLELLDDRILLFAAGRRYERLWDGDLQTAALLARTWLRELRVADGGWIPDLPPTLLAPVSLEQGATAVTPTEPTRPKIPVHGQLGLGLRMAPTSGLAIDGPRVTAALRRGVWSGEVAVFAAAGSYLRQTQLDRELGKLDLDEAYSSYLDVFTVQANAELAVPPPSSGMQGGPVAIAGAELRRSVLRQVTAVDDGSQRVELSPDVDQLDVGPVIGAGFDFWLHPSVRLRALAVDRVRYRQRSPDATRSWTHDYALCVDLLLAIGSAD